MSITADDDTLLLTGNLVLRELSNKKFPTVDRYQNIKAIDLHKLQNIDSAGIAYMAEIKSYYPNLRLLGGSDKLYVLANLYGLSFLFES